MTDITQRLRRPTFAIVTAHELMHEAADAIDRLNARLVAMAREYEAAREGNNRLRAALEISHPPLPVKMAECGVYCATAKTLIEEADRLRAALREIQRTVLIDPPHAGTLLGVAEAARAALGDGNADQA